MLIVIEGADAVGKATQTRRLVERVQQAGRKVTSFSFPRYGTPLGKAILRHLKGEITVANLAMEVGDTRSAIVAFEDSLILQCMMTADKYDAAVEINARLDSGEVVVLDRWWQSAYAYGAADGLDRRWLMRVHEVLPQGDLNVYIDLPPEEALRRRPELRDRYERDRAKQEIVRQNYRELWWDNTVTTLGETWLVIDGNQREDVVHEAIWTHVERGL